MGNPITYAGVTVGISTTVQNTDITRIAAPVQAAAATAATGGTIPAGTYYIKVTAVIGGKEGAASNEQSIVTTGSTSTVTANWAAVTGTGVTYNVYIGTTAGGENLVSTGVSAITLTLTALPTASGAPPILTPVSTLTFTQFSKVGKLGQYGYKTNMISYKVFDRLLDLKAKGSTDGGTLTIECATDLSDAGQLAATAASIPNIPDNYVFKITFPNGDIDYVRGPVGGPEYSGGTNESFRLSTFTVGVNQIA